MDYEIFNIFKNYTLEAFLIGFGAFLITYLIKYPIKKKTANLEENKRKMINIVIMFIPLVLSFVASVVYYGITKKQWMSLLVLDSSVSAWILSLSIYAIVSRIWLVIKGIRSGKVSLNQNLTRQTVSYIKDTIKALSKENKETQKSLTSIVNKISSLTTVRDLLSEDKINSNFAKISDLNSEIFNLEIEQKTKEKIIQDNNATITTYKTNLYKKQ